MSTSQLTCPVSIRQLALALAGPLQLGQLPPVDGPATLADRIVFCPRAIQPGTVFWDLAAPTSPPFHCPEEIFLRGASGVISPLRIEPWAGAFAIQVVDYPRAMLIAQQVARQQLLDTATPLASR